jgi:hypothetical protein
MNHLLCVSAIALTSAICWVAPNVTHAQDNPLAKYLGAFDREVPELTRNTGTARATIVANPKSEAFPGK